MHVHGEVQLTGSNVPDTQPVPVKDISMPLLTTAGYKLEHEDADFQVYLNTDNNEKVMAVFRNLAVKLNPSNQAITLSDTGINGAYTKAALLTSAYFPGLISGSFINNIFIVPWSRSSSGVLTATSWRMIVVTDKGQLYHNFPKRAATDGNDGNASAGDEMRFEESVIWDLEERKFPTKSATPSAKEYYFPCLPDEVYVHHPRLNDAGFVDTYGNSGFGLTKTIGSKTYARFYRSGFNVTSNSFVTFGGIDFSDNLVMMGTYRLNQFAAEGVRTGVFVSDDGGRQWYLKYEFSDAAGAVSNWANAINLANIVGSYVSSSFSINKKANVIPTNTTKEPTTKFTLGTAKNVVSITKASPAVLTTDLAHGWLTGEVVYLTKLTANSPDFEFMCNDTVSTSSHGNGVFFKVKVINTTTVELYEYVHAWSNPIPCQHVHGINRVKDGFVVTTGEIWPCGWLLYIETHASDNYGFVKAHDIMPITRLNSSDTGVQRGIGAVLPDDGTLDIIVASDTSESPRGTIPLATGRTETIKRSTVGVFRGKIADIDDFSKFVCILECEEPSYYFKEHNGVYYHFGQRGEFAVSTDKGKSWRVKQFSGSNFYKPGGYTNDFVVIGNAVIALK